MKLVSQVPDGYIPDDDLYNLRRRARKLLASIGVNVPAAGVSIIAPPNPADKAKADPHLPTVKIEPSNNTPFLNVKRPRDEDGDVSGQVGPGPERAKRPKASVSRS